jgi:hypothetical protein
MTSRTFIFLALLAAVLLMTDPGSVNAQRSFSTLEERMTAREFRQAGLDKLSDEELAALNRWIRQRSLAEGEVVAPVRDGARSADVAEDRRGFNDAGNDEPIRSRIEGTFKGWEGDTVFVLENGMVWQQSEGGTFRPRTMEDPEVEISQGFLGSVWYLKVEGYNTQVKVQRLR